MAGSKEQRVAATRVAGGLQCVLATYSGLLQVGWEGRGGGAVQHPAVWAG